MQLKALTPASGKLFEVQKRLSEAGFRAWLAGGCVRDAILGRVPADFDLVTDASVEQIQGLFEKTVEVGAAFGVVLVVQDGEEFEVAQFRKESDYRDGRHPSLVESATPEEDACRRDLTVNALFYDPKNQMLYDFVDGLRDLNDRKLRAVGDAKVRFQEDHLRILRAIRFKAQLRFEWDADLKAAIQSQVALLAKVSRERIREEIFKMSQGVGWTDVSKFLVEAKVNQTIFPDLQWKSDVHKSLPRGDDDSVWWEWGLWAWRSGNSVAKVCDSLGTLKLSKAEQKSLQGFLFWFEESSGWQKQSLGSLVEKSFQPGVRSGFQVWAGLHPGWTLTEKFLEITNRFPEAPLPWVKAEDLPGLRGPALGKTLRDLYHRQLEGLDRSREDALSFIKLSSPG